VITCAERDIALVVWLDSGSSAKFKPNACRLEMSIPLDTNSGNYQEVQDDHKRIKTMELR